MFSPENTTHDNIQAYLQQKNNQSFKMNNSFQNQEPSLSLLPYNSMPISQYQVGYQLPDNYNPNYGKRQLYNNTNNISTNEINLESSNEPNINNEIENNYENNINNNDKKKEEEQKKEIFIDPDREVFEENKIEEKKNEGNEEDLSALSDEDESNNEKEYNNHLLAQYEKVKRVKSKWKVSLKGCIAQKDDMEYVCGKVHGELSRDW